MKQINCETALMAKMAEFDGEDTGVSAETLNSHLSICENCRTEFEGLRSVGDLLNRQTRSETEVSLWSAIEPRLAAEKSRSANWKTFALLVTLLVGWKLLEMLPERDLGLAFKLVPFALAVWLFVLLKENPFTINRELDLEK